MYTSYICICVFVYILLLRICVYFATWYFCPCYTCHSLMAVHKTVKQIFFNNFSTFKRQKLPSLPSNRRFDIYFTVSCLSLLSASCLFTAQIVAGAFSCEMRTFQIVLRIKFVLSHLECRILLVLYNFLSRVG